MNGLQLRLLRCLQGANAPFLVIGGFAIRALGLERDTVDVDLIVSTAHAAQTLAGIAAFSPGLAAPLTVAQLELRSKRVMLESQHGHEGDILTSVGELDFEELYARRYVVQFNGLAVTFASAADQLAVKRISLASTERDLGGELAPDQRALAIRARDKDQADIALLERYIADN